MGCIRHVANPRALAGSTDCILSEIRVPEGEVAPVGAIVGVIGDGSGAVASVPAKRTPAAATAKAPATVAAPQASASLPKSQQPIKLDPFLEVRTPERNFGPARLPGGISVTPLARRLASDAGIDLSRLKGSGPHGRIVARDVETALRPTAAPSVGALAEGPTADQVKALYDPASYEEVPLDGMGKTIAARLQQAKQTIPHFYLTADITIDALIVVREEVNAAVPKDRDGKPLFKLSLSDFMICSLALALQRVPAANAAWAGDRILRFKHSDVGVAVALDGGLIVPVIRQAETKTLSAISAEMKDLAARARDKKLKPTEYQGGSAAISNLGMYGVPSRPSSIRRRRRSSPWVLRAGRPSRSPMVVSLSPACSRRRCLAIIASWTARSVPSFWPPPRR